MSLPAPSSFPFLKRWRQGEWDSISKALDQGQLPSEGHARAMLSERSIARASSFISADHQTIMASLPDYRSRGCHRDLIASSFKIALAMLCSKLPQLHQSYPSLARQQRRDPGLISALRLMLEWRAASSRAVFQTLELSSCSSIEQAQRMALIGLLDLPWIFDPHEPPPRWDPYLPLTGRSAAQLLLLPQGSRSSLWSRCSALHNDLAFDLLIARLPSLDQIPLEDLHLALLTRASQRLPPSAPLFQAWFERADEPSLSSMFSCFLSHAFESLDLAQAQPWLSACQALRAHPFIAQSPDPFFLMWGFRSKAHLLRDRLRFAAFSFEGFLDRSYRALHEADRSKDPDPSDLARSLRIAEMFLHTMALNARALVEPASLHGPQSREPSHALLLRQCFQASCSLLSRHRTGPSALPWVDDLSASRSAQTPWEPALLAFLERHQLSDLASISAPSGSTRSRL